PPLRRAPLFPYTTLFRSLDRVDSLSRDVFRRKRFQPAAGAAGDEPPPEARPAGRAVLRAVARLNQAFADGDLEAVGDLVVEDVEDRKSTRLNSSHEWISY